MNDSGNSRLRRKIIKITGFGSVAVWQFPVMKSIVLPAHAQTSSILCESNFTSGGPLIGNPYGAESCTDACQSAAEEVNGQLCAAEEMTEGTDSICHCDIEISQN